jgi:hypothetical protein
MIKAIFFLLLLLSTSFAQDMEQLIPIERGDIKKNIFFCIDKSGSMTPENLGQAINSMVTIASQNADEFNIAASVFGEESDRWEGVENKKTAPQWAQMPDQQAIEKLKEWFDKTLVGKKSTIPSPSIVDGLDEDVRELSLIIISDGQFNGPDASIEALVGKIVAWQAARVKAEKFRAKIGILAINPTKSTRNRLRHICQQIDAWLVETK